MAPHMAFAAGSSFLGGRGLAPPRGAALCRAGGRACVARATLAQGSDVGSRVPRRDIRDAGREARDRNGASRGPRRDSRDRGGGEREPFRPIEGATYYTECGACAAAYPLDPAVLGAGRKVCCEVCGNTWFQRADRLRIVDDRRGLKDYPLDRKEELMQERRERRERRVRARRDATSDGGGGYSRAGGASDTAPRRSSGGRTGGSNGRGGPQFTVFIGNLPFDAIEEDLREHVSSAAEVSRVTIIKDRETGRSRGFGFATVASEADVRACVDALDGVNFHGRQLTLREGNKK